MTVKEWYEGDGNRNLILEGEGFYISYVPSSVVPVIPSFASDNNSDETAICDEDGHFYILNGDFRKQYEAVIDNGLKACMKIFKENFDHVSSWSDLLPS